MPEPIADSLFPPVQATHWTVDQVLEKIRIDAMVDTYADQGASNAKVAAMRPFVEQLHAQLNDLRSDNPQTSGRAAARSRQIMLAAGLKDAQIFPYLNSQLVSDAALRVAGLNPEEVNPERSIKHLLPAITGANPTEAKAALRQAIKILVDFRGLKGPEPYYRWLSKNVKNDDVLRGAGIDPDAMRKAIDPGDPHPDVAALLDAARTMMGAMMLQNPSAGDQNAAAAIAAFNRFSGTNVALPAALTAPGGNALTVRQLLALPVRA